MNTRTKEGSFSQEVTMKMNSDVNEMKKEIKEECTDPDFCLENDWQFFTKDLVMKKELDHIEEVTILDDEGQLCSEEPVNHHNNDCDPLLLQQRGSSEAPSCENQAEMRMDNNYFPAESTRLNTGIATRGVSHLMPHYDAAPGWTMYPYSAGKCACSIHCTQMLPHFPSGYPNSALGFACQNAYMPIPGASYRSSSETILPHSPTSQPTIITLDSDEELPAHQKKQKSTSSKKKRTETHIKKPLNVFMIYMKEMRAQVKAHEPNKDNAAINQILAHMWRELAEEKRAKYYELAHQELLLHQKRYPNYKCVSNPRVGKKKHIQGIQRKKCRALYGVEEREKWCTFCRSKKKCIRYRESDDNAEKSKETENDKD